MRWFVLLLLLALCPHAPAVEPMAFAVPDDGRITLGVFDSHGKLVRRLHELAPQSSFQAGLNGLITRWDGKDDGGNEVPAGTYHVRGYLVGEVAVEGRDYHFNDWVSSENEPVPVRIRDFLLLDAGDVVLSAEDADGRAFVSRYSPERGMLWHQPMGSAPRLASLDAGILCLAGNLTLLDAGTGAPVGDPVPASGQALAATGTSVALLDGDEARFFRWPDVAAAARRALPAGTRQLDVFGDAVCTASQGGLYLSKGAQEFRKITPVDPVTSVSFGANATVWFTGGSPSAVGQLSEAGELLRQLSSGSGEPAPVVVRAARTSEAFAVLEEGGGVQRLRALFRGEDGQWLIEWERSIRAFGDFAFQEGAVVANPPDSAPAELSFRLDANPLTGERPILALHAVAGPDGPRLETPDGLALVEIATRPAASQRLRLTRGDAPDAVRVAFDGGGVVEEFEISGLRHITPLNVGEIEKR